MLLFGRNLFRDLRHNVIIGSGGFREDVLLTVVLRLWLASLAAAVCIVISSGSRAAYAEAVLSKIAVDELYAPADQAAPSPEAANQGCDAWGVSTRRYSPDSPLDMLGSGSPACLHRTFSAWMSDCEQIGFVGLPGTCAMSRALTKLCGLTDYDSLWEDPCYVSYWRQAPEVHYLFFSESCARVPALNQKELTSECTGALTMSISPVSLLWDGARWPADHELGFSRFPLDPARRDAWYTWEASESAPLLVYDPEHKGEIVSAHQLFGAWTFGGKKYASLAAGTGSTDAAGRAGAWENGYEALGTMDADGDGKLSGDELSALALWFDRNRDGVSQGGEVRTLQHAGVVVLYYRGAQPGGGGRDLLLEKGYERLVDGRVVSGASVDWYSSYASSQAALLMRELLPGGGRPPVSAREGAEPAVHSRMIQVLPYDGVWEWRDESGEQHGILVLSGREGSERLKGLAFVESRLNENGGGKISAKSMALMLPLRGRSAVNSSGITELEFLVSNGAGTETRTRAALSADGQGLRGISRLSRADAGGPRTVYQYSWSAKRIEE
jgi:hypothetical protein